MCPDCEGKISFKKSFIVLGVVALGLWGLKSYADENMDHSKMNHGKMDHKKMSKEVRRSIDDATKASLVNALEANEKLHQSFFEYDGKKVEENALNLQKAIDGIKDKEISKLLSYSKNKLSEIKATIDREVNNKNYNLVSMALIHVVSKYDVGNDYNAYSCPMVKMKWIQNTSKVSEVHNPYAPNMPNCGSQDSNYK